MWQCCGLRIVALFVFTIVEELHAVENRRHSLNLLSNAELKVPIVAIVYQNKENLEGIEAENDIMEDITPELDSLDPPHDQKAYMFYHMLRTTQEKEHLDPEAARTIEATKDILRQALRKRCQKLSSCIRRCPTKKTYICTIQCQDTYDDYNVCEEPKKQCNTPKCGRTMPPSWLLLRNQLWK